MKTRKIKGGTIAKDRGEWKIVNNEHTNDRVTKYRKLEVEVLNKLAIDSVSSNSNEALLEPVLEESYGVLCETFKSSRDETLYTELKNLKEDIGKIIQYRHEEGLDRLKPNETTEEVTERKKHEYRVKLWRNKYKIIKRLFRDVRRFLHMPVEYETDKLILEEKLEVIESNLSLIDRVFNETIRKIRELQDDLSVYLGFKETLPVVFESTTTFSQTLQPFIDQKQSELLASKDILILKRTKIAEILVEMNQEELEEREEIERIEIAEREERVKKEGLQAEERVRKEGLQAEERVKKEGLQAEERERKEGLQAEERVERSTKPKKGQKPSKTLSKEEEADLFKKMDELKQKEEDIIAYGKKIEELMRERHELNESVGAMNRNVASFVKEVLGGVTEEDLKKLDYQIFLVMKLKLKERNGDTDKDFNSNKDAAIKSLIEVKSKLIIELKTSGFKIKDAQETINSYESKIVEIIRTNYNIKRLGLHIEKYIELKEKLSLEIKEFSKPVREGGRKTRKRKRH